MNVLLVFNRASVVRFYWIIGFINLGFITMTALRDIGVLPDRYRYTIWDLKEEGNLAVWYSSLLLSLCALASAVAASRKDMVLQSVERWFFAGLAAAFLLLSMDEAASIHEHVGRNVSREALGSNALTDKNPAFAWVLVYAPLALVFSALTLYAASRWRDDYRRSSKLMALAIACWLGVFVAEAGEAWLLAQGWNRGLQGTLEEGLEIVGSTLFLIALLELFHPTPETLQ